MLRKNLLVSLVFAALLASLAGLVAPVLAQEPVRAEWGTWPKQKGWVTLWSPEPAVGSVTFEVWSWSAESGFRRLGQHTIDALSGPTGEANTARWSHPNACGVTGTVRLTRYPGWGSGFGFGCVVATPQPPTATATATATPIEVPVDVVYGCQWDEYFGGSGWGYFGVGNASPDVSVLLETSGFPKEVPPAQEILPREWWGWNFYVGGGIVTGWYRIRLETGEVIKEEVITIGPCVPWETPETPTPTRPPETVTPTVTPTPEPPKPKLGFEVVTVLCRPRYADNSLIEVCLRSNNEPAGVQWCQALGSRSDDQGGRGTWGARWDLNIQYEGVQGVKPGAELELLAGRYLTSTLIVTKTLESDPWALNGSKLWLLPDEAGNFGFDQFCPPDKPPRLLPPTAPELLPVTGGTFETTHVVVNSDSLWSIWESLGRPGEWTSFRDSVAAANGLADPSFLEVDQLLLIPAN